MREIDPLMTKRWRSWELYHQAPMPMVTIFQTLDITNLMRWQKRGYKMNMLLCYCIGKAAQCCEEFYLLPQGERMLAYDQIGISVIVANAQDGINSCDIPFTDDLETFNERYLHGTQTVRETCSDLTAEDCMMIGTSALVDYEVDGAINMYSGIYNNPFLIWGKYKEEGEKITLKISFQFHHVQMDGREACEFLKRLQEEADEWK